MMQPMRDIVPYADADPTPDRPPRPPVPREPRRKLRAALLASFLGLALLVASVGSIVVAFGRMADATPLSFPLASVLETISSAYRRIAGFAGSSVALVRLGNEALALAPDLLKGKRGDELIALLGRAQDELAALGSTGLVPELGAKGSDLATAAGAFREWLDSAEERRVAVVFGNSAEMRAGGGFIGSYAEVTLRRGAVAGIVVRDINDADSGSGDRTIPPPQLEPVAARWRAADANWFLSGPASGAAFLNLLNRSPLYKDKPVDAAFFVAPRVVSDFLALTGPIEAGGVTVDKDNFLRVIQNEVQEGQASGAESPKAVLTALVPAFTDALLSQARSQPLAVVETLRNGVARRDIVAYADDAAVERALDLLGMSGSLYPTGDRFVGGYVAVAPSTIGGDKTDAVTGQEVRVRQQLFPKGLVETTVEVERAHRGADDDPWWYREEHRSYVKVYAPQDSTPLAATGIWLRDRALATYDGTFSAYEPLATVLSTRAYFPDVPGVESYREADKTVFGFWQRTARGASTVARLSYATQLPRELRDGDAYAFVLERQPASTSSYRVDVYAPPGFRFAESGTARYQWSSEDPAGRTVTALTLQAAP